MKKRNKIGFRVLVLSLMILFFIDAKAEEVNSKKVFIHYMAWFGPESYGRHWNSGAAHEPIIGYYDSRSWAAQMHHMLLSWSCGIDGLLINVRDSYDDKCLRLLTPSLNRILEVDPTFNYQFAVSYDDQGMGSVEVAREKFTYLRDYILPQTNSYVHYNSEPVVFIWNYPDYLSAKEYRTTINEVFTDSEPLLIWNEINEAGQEYVNSFYPWVQDFADDGSNWGSDYLTWFYNTIGGKSSLNFATGGVYPGFDDRACSWGQNRWQNRRGGDTYDDTWNLVNNYIGALPLDWVVIETWNDWNEGSEVEPSVEHGFLYLQKTIRQINMFKDTLNVIDEFNFLASTKLYEAALKIEKGERDSVEYYPLLQKSIQSFLDAECSTSVDYSNRIIQGSITGIGNLGLAEINVIAYPNPASGYLRVQLDLTCTEHVTLRLYNTNGIVVKELNSRVLNQGLNEMELNLNDLNAGLYFYEVAIGTEKISKKIIIK